MTPEMQQLFSGSNRVILIMWLLMGIPMGSKTLLGSVLVLSFFILIMKTNSHLAFIASILIPLVFIWF